MSSQSVSVHFQVSENLTNLAQTWAQIAINLGYLDQFMAEKKAKKYMSGAFFGARQLPAGHLNLNINF